MNVFRNENVRRILRPAATLLGLVAAIWHAMHALSMWRQMKEWRATDPSLADFFWGAFQSELAVILLSVAAGVLAWHLFKPRVTNAAA